MFSIESKKFFMGGVNRLQKKSTNIHRYRFLFDVLKLTTSDYLFMIDLESHACIFSPAFAKDFQLPSDHYICDGNQILPMIHPDDRELYKSKLQTIRDGFELEYRLRDRSGDYIPLRARGSIGKDRDGKPIICAGSISRISRRDQIDDVTGLLNKYQFEKQVKIALSEYRSNGVGGAILFFGLDNFRIINETHNRLIGDEVLRHVAKIVANTIPSSVKFFKLDGDEFALIYPAAADSEIEKLFESIQIALAVPQEIEGHTYACTASAGTVFYPESGKDYLVLHKHAEAAMDIAKREGKNRNVIFSRAQYNRWIRSLSMRENLWASVENEFRDFELFFQPQVSSNSQQLLGAEALLRWHNPKGKMVSPMEFIPILEETGLILPVGRWVFETALKVCKQWRQSIPSFHVSVNMSYDQVKDMSFRDFVQTTLEKHEMPPESIILELTESKIVADWNFVNRRFDSFREMGIRIAMDDFGTGYSSLASLKYLSCDIVKIDREFVKKIVENEFDRKLVKYTVELCHSIGIKTCIEGVETEEEYRILTEMCHADSIQGYLFGHPESIENFEEKFLRR